MERLGDVPEGLDGLGKVDRSVSTRWRRARRMCRAMAIDAHSRTAKARIEMANRTGMAAC